LAARNSFTGPAEGFWDYGRAGRLGVLGRSGDGVLDGKGKWLLPAFQGLDSDNLTVVTAVGSVGEPRWARVLC